MPSYTVIHAYDACKYAAIEADSPEQAVEKAEDEIDPPGLCHQCTGDIEIGDQMWTRVDDDDSTVYDDSHEAKVCAERDDLAKQVLRLESYLEYILSAVGDCVQTERCTEDSCAAQAVVTEVHISTMAALQQDDAGKPATEELDLEIIARIDAAVAKHKEGKG